MFQDIDKNLAEDVLLFMVVGVTSDIQASIGYFGTKGAKAGVLYKLFWDAVCYIEVSCGLKVSLILTSTTAYCVLRTVHCA